MDFTLGTTLSSGSTTSHEQNDQPLPQTVVWLWRVCPPVILVLGTFGNVMTIVVLRRMRARQSAVSMYIFMSALALSDLILLYAGLLRRWLRHGYDFEILRTHDIICKTNKFVVYSCGTMSSFILATLSVQRALSVAVPHRANLIFDRKKSIAGVAIIMVFSSAINCYLPFVFGIVDIPGSGYQECHSVSEEAEYYFSHVHNWIDLSFTSLTPSCILIGSNAVIFWKVVQSSRTTSGHASGHSRLHKKVISSLTLTLILVSVVFLLLTLPMCTFIVYSYTISGKNEYGHILPAEHHVAHAVCYLLYYTNSAVNFYLYCLSGTKFKQELKLILGLFILNVSCKKCVPQVGSSEVPVNLASRETPTLPGTADNYTK